MAKLIDALLDLSRVSRAEMHLQTIDLGAEASQIAEELQRSGPDRCVRFVIQQPVWALADPTLIGTVLQNLLDNAWKYSSHRDDALIEFATTPAGDAPVCYYVRDNGAGLTLPTSTSCSPLPAAAHARRIPRHRHRPRQPAPDRGAPRRSGRAEGAVGEGATFYFTLDAKETT